MTAEWVAELQAEIREMIRKAIEENRYSIIVALEPDEDDEKGIADRGGNHEPRQSDDPRA